LQSSFRFSLKDSVMLLLYLTEINAKLLLLFLKNKKKIKVFPLQTLLN